MTKFSAFPPELNSTIERLAQKRTDSKDDRDLALVRAEELADIKQELAVAEREVVDELRRLGVPWNDIADAFGEPFDTVWGRHNRNKNKTPESRRAKAHGMKKPLKRGSERMSVTEAARVSRRYRSTINTYIKNNPDAPWFERVPTEGKREFKVWIVNLEAMERDIAPPVHRELGKKE